jgi:hypothetical protein
VRSDSGGSLNFCIFYKNIIVIIMTTTSVIYKYVTVGAAKAILNSNSIRFTPPNEFNDPFEFLPAGYSGVTKELIENKLTEPIYNSIISSNNRIINDKIVEMVTVKMVDPDANIIRARQFVDGVSSIIGVCSLTKNNSNILMWSHYASEHTGVVIGFDEGKLPNRAIKVIYDDVRPSIPFRPPTEEDAEVLAKTKYSKWSYEEEYRVLMALNFCEPINDISPGKIIYTKKLPDKAIVEVICGCYTPQIEIDEISIIAHTNNSNIGIKRASINNTNYSMNIS